MTGLASDVRFAFRALSRAPRFAALAIVILALGIGGTTALFSVVDAVLLRALPFHEPDRLVEIFGEDRTRSGTRVPRPLLDALRERSTTLQAIALYGPTAGATHTKEGAVRLFGDRVSANFIDVMGVPPLAGRGFVPDDERPGAPAVMIVSFDFWQQVLEGDPEAVGRTIPLDGIPHTVIGIMPSRFRTKFPRAWDYWTTHVTDSLRNLEREMGFELIGRLSPGATIDDARRELHAISAGVKVDVEDWREGDRRLGLRRLKDEIVRDSAYALQLLLGAVVVVLAIACANLAQLLLARSDARMREFAVRQAMGARGSQLFRLALLESLMLSAAGGALGVALAYWLVPVILWLAPTEIPRLAEAAIDGRVLAVAVTLSVLTGCAFGLAPALRLSRLSVLQAMKRTPVQTTFRRARLRPTLVLIQVAASVTLCALAGLVGQTFLTLLPSNPGFEASARAMFPLLLRSDLFPTPADRRQRMDDVVRRLAALPGVTGVALESNVPFGEDDRPTRAVRRVDDPGRHDGATQIQAVVHAVSPNLLRILQIPLLRGRAFTTADASNAPAVAIVNQRVASWLAPGGNVIGRRIRVGNAPDAPVREIVGVVTGTRASGTSVDIPNDVYVPYAQSSESHVELIVHSPLDSASLTAMIRRTLREVAPDLSMRRDLEAMMLDDLVHQALARPRFSAVLMGAFSAMAMMLTVIGLFGMVAYAVTQRAHELGIRAALGAQGRDLLATTLRPALALTAAGIVSGLLAGAWLTRFVESQLYAIAPLDLPTFAGAGAVMLTAAALAAYIPARRVVRTDPLIALRHD